ncbi:helix-turn-helix domain-containing protein [Agrobacterium tumefaciens str. Cherry 2E-2-2]|nr:helix-turn-helix domain-containing protein [Agrobacterium tumefaciens str. Cherry 2E-2-2]
MELRKIFGSNIRHHRKALGLTQEALAEKADLSIEMMGRLERGDASPSFETIESIAKALGLPAIAFFGTGTVIAPEGERGRLLHRVNAALAHMNEDDLVRVTRMLEAFTGKP